MKAQCFMYKINKILQWLKITIEKKEKRKIEKKKKEITNKGDDRNIKAKGVAVRICSGWRKMETEMER